MSSRFRKTFAVVAVIATAISLSACSASGQSGPSGGKSSAAYVKQVKQVVAEGKSGLLYYDGEDKDATPTTLKQLTGWQGPTSAPTPAKNKTIAVIYCTKGSSCEDVAGGAAAAAKSLGWNTILIDGQGTPQGYAAAMQTALAKKVGGIITVAIAESLIQDSISSAKAQGVPIVGVAEDESSSPNRYDAYIPLHETLAAMMEGWYAIADTNGKARVATLWDVGFPHLVNALAALNKVLKGCAGCTVVSEQTAETSVFGNPVAISEKSSSLVQRYQGKLDWLLSAYDYGLQGVAQGVSTGSNGKVKLATKNDRESNEALIQQGLVQMDSGTSTDWAGWAATDELVRIFAKSPVLPYWKEGLPLHVIDKSNLPAGNNYDWKAKVDFESEYRGIWGVTQ
jgi:ribose transport system substrate-binding protein